jgi:hypothetical protein
MKRTLCVMCLAAAGSFAIPSVSMAHGMSGNHMVAMNAHDNEDGHDRYRHSGNYFGFPYGAYGVNYYDSDYCYTPTPEQIAAAQEQVEDYFVALEARNTLPPVSASFIYWVRSIAYRLCTEKVFQGALPSRNCGFQDARDLPV